MRIEEFGSRLAGHRPSLLDPGDDRHAAVAMILRHARPGPEVLLIERTRSERDPWSGQMAFPGGMVEASDACPRSAAMRETLEEVGIDLTDAAFMGRLDDVEGRHRGLKQGIIVSGFVFLEQSGAEPVSNYEVAEAVWEPLATFSDPRQFACVRHPAAPGERFPGIRVGRCEHQVVWGLTRRFLVSFFEIAGQPFAAGPAESRHNEREVD